MADLDITTARAALTAQALATMGVDTTWDAKVSSYLRAEALAAADQEFGPYARAIDEFDTGKARLIAQYGEAYRRFPEGASRMDAIWEKMRAAEEARSDGLLKGLWQAEREVTLTPAPTLAAALFKAQLIAYEEVWNDTHLNRDAFEIVAEDFARLAGEDA